MIYLDVIIPFVMALINIPFAIKNLTPYWFNWVAFGFCFGMGVCNLLHKG